MDNEEKRKKHLEKLKAAADAWDITEEEYQAEKKFHTTFEEELVELAKVLKEREEAGDLEIIDDEEEG